MATEDSTMQSDFPPIKQRPKLRPVGTADEVSQTIIVLFEMETTSLWRDSDICQIAFKPLDGRSKIWSLYMIPTCDILPSATSVNNLIVDEIDGKKVLINLKDDEPVNAMEYTKGMHRVYKYLRRYAKIWGTGTRILLTSHNCLGFDSRILLNAFKKIQKTSKDLQKLKIGFADSLKILRQLRTQGLLFSEEGENNSLKLTEVFKKVTGQERDLPDVIEKIEMLELIFKSLSIKPVDLLEHSVTPISLWNQMIFLKEKNPRLQTLRRTLAQRNSTGTSAITPYMADKMAESGLTFGDIRTVYRRHGDRGLKKLFTQTVPATGRVRVTNQISVENIQYLNDNT